MLTFLLKAINSNVRFARRLEIQELKLEENAQTVAELTERLKQYEEDLERKDSVSLTQARAQSVNA